MKYRVTSVLSVALSFALYTMAFAQTPTQPSGQANGGINQQAVLNGILSSWEADAKSLQSLYVQFAIEETDPTWKKKEMFHGEAKVLKMPSGQYGFKLETFAFDPTGSKPDFTKPREKIVCSGTWLYTFDFSTKVITFRRMENQNAKPDDGPFAFLFGMKAAEANRRFTMSIVQQDKDYTWVRITPLTPQDQRDFSVAQLGVINYANAVSPKDFPLRIMWKEPGNKEISWLFRSVVRNDLTKVNMTDFSVENEKRQGWQLREAPALGAVQPGNNQLKGTPTGGGAPRK